VSDFQDVLRTDGRLMRRRMCRSCRKVESLERIRPVREYVDSIKLSRGCTDCGYAEHPAALDFDHRPGTHKVAGIAAMITTATFDELVIEIAKCDVVCANCHRIRGATRGYTDGAAIRRRSRR
jgi:hypothetical protein